MSKSDLDQTQACEHGHTKEECPYHVSDTSVGATPSTSKEQYPDPTIKISISGRNKYTKISYTAYTSLLVASQLIMFLEGNYSKSIWHWLRDRKGRFTKP